MKSINDKFKKSLLELSEQSDVWDKIRQQIQLEEQAKTHKDKIKYPLFQKIKFNKELRYVAVAFSLCIVMVISAFIMLNGGLSEDNLLANQEINNHKSNSIFEETAKNENNNSIDDLSTSQIKNSKDENKSPENQKSNAFTSVNIKDLFDENAESINYPDFFGDKVETSNSASSQESSSDSSQSSVESSSEKSSNCDTGGGDESREGASSFDSEPSVSSEVTSYPSTGGGPATGGGGDTAVKFSDKQNYIKWLKYMKITDYIIPEIDGYKISSIICYDEYSPEYTLFLLKKDNDSIMCKIYFNNQGNNLTRLYKTSSSITAKQKLNSQSVNLDNNQYIYCEFEQERESSQTTIFTIQKGFAIEIVYGRRPFYQDLLKQTKFITTN